MTYMTNADVIKLINTFCDKYDTFAEAAKGLRCTPSQLSQARQGKLGMIPAPILKKLGLKPLTVYVSRSGKPLKLVATSKGRQQGKAAGLSNLPKPPRPPKGFVHYAPPIGETPALKPTKPVLSHDESDFADIGDDNDFNEVSTGYTGIHINAFGDD
jgi:hypothetical protein